MNSIAAANPLENPLVLVAIVLFGALSNWLMKRRQAGALASPNEGKLPPAHGQQERPARPPDLQDILRQLLGGEPPPAVTPPPIPHAVRDGQTPAVERDEEPLHSEQMWPDESRESHGRPLRQRKRVDEQSSALAARIETDDRQVNTVHNVVPFDRQAEHPVKVMVTARRGHASVGGPGVRLWCEPRIVRRAFVASLVFAPPKGLEA